MSDRKDYLLSLERGILTDMHQTVCNFWDEIELMEGKGRLPEALIVTPVEYHKIEVALGATCLCHNPFARMKPNRLTYTIKGDDGWRLGKPIEIIRKDDLEAKAEVVAATMTNLRAN